MKLETLAIHAGYSTDPTTKAVAVPIYQTTSYAFDNTQHGADLFDLKVQGNIYTRIMNPTTAVLEQRVAELEGGIGGLALASGMAAITYAIQTIAQAGDNIVSVSTLYGGTYNLFAHTLPKQGIEVRFFDYRDPASLEKLIDDKTKLVFAETIGNPLGNVVDLEAISAIAHRHGGRIQAQWRQHGLHALMPRLGKIRLARGRDGLRELVVPVRLGGPVVSCGIVAEYRYAVDAAGAVHLAGGAGEADRLASEDGSGRRKRSPARRTGSPRQGSEAECRRPRRQGPAGGRAAEKDRPALCPRGRGTGFR